MLRKLPGGPFSSALTPDGALASETGFCLLGPYAALDNLYTWRLYLWYPEGCCGIGGACVGPAQQACARRCGQLFCGAVAKACAETRDGAQPCPEAKAGLPQ